MKLQKEFEEYLIEVRRSEDMLRDSVVLRSEYTTAMNALWKSSPPPSSISCKPGWLVSGRAVVIARELACARAARLAASAEVMEHDADIIRFSADLKFLCAVADAYYGTATVVEPTDNGWIIEGDVYETEGGTVSIGRHSL